MEKKNEKLDKKEQYDSIEKIDFEFDLEGRHISTLSLSLSILIYQSLKRWFSPLTKKK